MAIDVTKFFKANVTDTCSIWNILSSRTLYASTRQQGLSLCCTSFVLYECLYKLRECTSESDNELVSRLHAARGEHDFKDYHISIDDLQAVEVLENRGNLSKGEISSIVFAKKTKQAFLTDDQAARRLAITFLSADKIQTVPQLLGWLVYVGAILNGQVSDILAQHEEMNRPLRKWMNEAYILALQMRLAT